MNGLRVANTWSQLRPTFPNRGGWESRHLCKLSNRSTRHDCTPVPSDDWNHSTLLSLSHVKDLAVISRARCNVLHWHLNVVVRILLRHSCYPTSIPMVHSSPVSPRARMRVCYTSHYPKVGHDSQGAIQRHHGMRLTGFAASPPIPTRCRNFLRFRLHYHPLQCLPCTGSSPSVYSARSASASFLPFANVAPAR